MPVEKQQDRVILTHPKGASVELLFYGATVISWKSGSISKPEPVERLFVSSKAALDSSKAVRGGIPVVFPCFGPPSHPEHLKLGQHGFARSEVWAWDKVVMDNGAGVSVRLTLEPSPGIQAVYDRAFHLTYVVTLAEHQLSTDLHVMNPSNSSESLPFQALFHNYIRAPSKNVLITPLRNVSYIDKTETTEEMKTIAKVETRDVVDVRNFTDFVYLDAPQKYMVSWPGGVVEVKSVEMKNLVVWNPQESGGKLADMEDGGWENFVCVEPGFVRDFQKVEPGKTWIGQQVLTVVE